MEHLTGKDLRQLSEFLRELYQLRTHEEFTTHLIAAVPSITEGEFTTYNEFHTNGKEGVVKSDQIPHISNPGLYAGIINHYANEHPFLAHLQRTKDGTAKVLSDFLSEREFRRTPLFNEFYKPLQIPYLAVMAIAVDQHTCITLSRHRTGHEFGEKTRRTLNTIRPHVLQGFRNAMAVTHMEGQLATLHQAMENSQQALLAVTPEGRIKWATPQAFALLKQYGVRIRSGDDGLPSRLRDWTIHQQRQLDAPAEVAIPISPLEIVRGNASLSIRLVRNGCQSLLLLAEARQPSNMAELSSLGLSKRETETLSWVAQGKTNPEIGTILGISPRTVQKHLERIYIKLGVENRHSATRVATETAQTCRNPNSLDA